MQWLKIRLLPALIFALLFAYSATTASALAPHIIGKVVNRDTGEGIPGMVIKWQDSAEAKSGTDENGIRYTVTQADGTFRFASWHLPPERQGLGTEDLREAERDAMIDTDYNGTPDKQKASTSEGSFFGCGENPHTFSLMLPRPGMDGTFEPTSITTSINNGDYEHDIGTFYYQPVTPRCPGNIRLASCDIVNSTATIAWDAPPGRVDGYKVYFDQEPFNVLSDGDGLHPLMSNILQRTQRITLDKRYIVRARTLRTVDNQQLESESCLAEFKCNSICTPGSPGCQPPKQPTGSLSGELCPEKPNDFYYNFTLNNINTDGQQFVNSTMMMVFYLNVQTQEIMDFLNDNPEGPPYTFTADFSQWKERNTTPQQDHYFGYYVQTFTTLPANNTLTFKLDDNTRIGKKTIGQLRQFLADNSLNTQYIFKANMSTKTSSGGDLFNSHIPLPGSGKIDLSKAQDLICDPNEPPPPCTVGTCPTIDITIPDPGQTVQPVSNRIPVSWTTSNPAITEFQVLVYDTTVYSATTANTEFESAIAAGRAPVKVRRYTATGLTQQANVSGLGNAIGVAVRGVVPNPICSETPAPIPPQCSWTPIDVALGYTVTGKFYLDNQCTSTDVGDEIPMTGQISANGETINLNNDRSYAFNLPYDGAKDIVLQIGGSDFICAGQDAPLQCPTVVSSNTCKIEDITGPGVKNFYVQTALSQFKSWWQVRGGLVYGHNGINSNLPFDADGNTSCDEPFCKPFLIRRELLNSGEKTAGIPMTNSGGFGSIINGWWTDRATNNKTHTEGTNNLLTGESREDSAYFKKLLANKVTARTSPGTISSLPADARTVVEDAEVWHYTGDLTIKPSSTWNVSNKQVVIVDGNIRFETDGPEQLITVSRGGFLAFISSKDIIFDNEIGAATADVSDTQTNIEGIFIADGILKIEGNGAGGDKKFIGAGTFVGWSNVELQRRFDNPNDANDTTNQLKNTNMPVESFFYRPDFTINAPTFMKSASYTWKEVN